MKIASLVFLLSAVLICVVPSMAETVYRSVDENGVVTFSDTPPADDTPAESITIDTPQPQSPESARQRLEDMRETTDRMVADRQAREKHRAEMRELQARTQAQSQPPPNQGYNPDYYDYYPAYSGTRVVRRNYYGDTPWRPGYRPGHDRPGHDRPGHDRPGDGYRPRPEHPIARPPLRPGVGHRPDYGPQSNVNLGGNSQLMRPIVSPRR